MLDTVRHLMGRADFSTSRIRTAPAALVLQLLLSPILHGFHRSRRVKAIVFWKRARAGNRCGINPQVAARLARSAGSLAQVQAGRTLQALMKTSLREPSSAWHDKSDLSADVREVLDKALRRLSGKESLT